MTLVLDASLVVAALVDDGPDGQWAASRVESEHLVGPHLMPAEATTILRRSILHGTLSEDVAAQAHADLHLLSVDLVPYELVAPRVWELRRTVTAYDAWYVAVAELMAAPLATLDLRLSRASGPRCRFLTPPPA